MARISAHLQLTDTVSGPGRSEQPAGVERDYHKTPNSLSRGERPKNWKNTRHVYEWLASEPGVWLERGALRPYQVTVSVRQLARDVEITRNEAANALKWLCANNFLRPAGRLDNVRVYVLIDPRSDETSASETTPDAVSSHAPTTCEIESNASKTHLKKIATTPRPATRVCESSSATTPAGAREAAFRAMVEGQKGAITRMFEHSPELAAQELTRRLSADGDGTHTQTWVDEKIGRPAHTGELSE